MSVEITFLGHAGLLLEADGKRVAVDPFLSNNPAATMEASDVRCDTIALTHGHADHFGDTIEIAKANDATVIGAFEIAEYCQELGVTQTEPMNPGGQIETDFGWVAMTPAFHSSSYQRRYLGMPCGLVINIGGVTIYHCGDTALFSDMKLYGEIYKPDIAFIPAGDRFTMGPKLATMAAEFIQPKVAVPIHFGTWPLLAQDMGEFAPRGIETKVLKPGEVWTYG